MSAMKRILLIADNDPDFLNTRAEYLEAEGYKVYKAFSVEQVESLLELVWVNVAVIDLRLRDDSDPEDVSGLWLAKNLKYLAVPKIILTRWPTYQAVREALGPSVEGLPPAVDFVAKQEGPRLMLESIERAFQRHVRLNANLSIQYGEDGQLTFLYLASLIETGLDDYVLLHRAEEMEGLFRRVFQRENSIRIDRLLWQSKERIALSVFASADGYKPESLVVVCGKNACIAEEACRYQDFAPKAPSRNATILTRSSETLHYGANTYALSESGTKNLQSLQRLYYTGPEKSFNNALSILFETVLVDWHQEKLIVEESNSFEDIYCERLGLTSSRWSEYEKCVQLITRQSLTLGENMELSDGRLKIHFPGHIFSYPDPTHLLTMPSRSHFPSVVMATPGQLSGKNLLTDEGGNIWLTDFAGAGLAPSLWNYTSLEAVIRFDWIKTNKLQWLHKWSDILYQTNSPNFTRGMWNPLFASLYGQYRMFDGLHWMYWQ